MSGFYLDGKEQLLARTIPAEAGIYVIGVNEDYEYDAGHTEFASFSPYILLPEQELSNVSFTNGILRADNVEWIAAAAGVDDRSLNLQGVALYFQWDDGGTPVGSFICFINRAIVGLPQTLKGVNVTCRWSTLGIFKL